MASNRSYVGEIGVPIRLNTYFDLTGYSTFIIKVSKPSGATQDWVATRDGTTAIIQHTTAINDLDEVGSYSLQAYIAKTGHVHWGDTVIYEILDLFT